MSEESGTITIGSNMGIKITGNASVKVDGKELKDGDTVGGAVVSRESDMSNIIPIEVQYRGDRIAVYPSDIVCVEEVYVSPVGGRVWVVRPKNIKLKYSLYNGLSYAVSEEEARRIIKLSKESCKTQVGTSV